jgi:hypothetical protein
MSRALFPSQRRVLADAKDLLDKNLTCLDLLVSADGFATSVVTGWITNVIVLNERYLNG